VKHADRLHVEQQTGRRIGLQLVQRRLTLTGVYRRLRNGALGTESARHRTVRRPRSQRSASRDVAAAMLSERTASSVRTTTCEMGALRVRGSARSGSDFGAVVRWCGGAERPTWQVVERAGSGGWTDGIAPTSTTVTIKVTEPSKVGPGIIATSRYTSYPHTHKGAPPGAFSWSA
jgi:hypothetical protein